MQSIHIALPHWMDDFLSSRPSVFVDDHAQMTLALDLARENVRLGTGGPFGAAVFAAHDGQLLAVGVNLVVATRCSLAHAELVAIASAQQRLDHYDLSQAVPGGCVLASSAEPCAMCLGAVPWSGVTHLMCAARDADVRAVGFDEGHKPADWVDGYAQRGIRVTRDLLRDDAIAVLRTYAANGGEVYGPGDAARALTVHLKTFQMFS